MNVALSCFVCSVCFCYKNWNSFMLGGDVDN